MTVVDIQEASVSINGDRTDVDRVTCTLDRTWSPYVQATVVIGGVVDIDPDELDRLQVTIAQRFATGPTADEIAAIYPGLTADSVAAAWAPATARAIARSYQTALGDEWHEPTRFLADLLIREVDVSLDQRKTTLQCASDDAQLYDIKLVQTYPEPFASTSVRAVVATVLARFGFVLSSGTADSTLEQSPLWTPGQSLRDFLSPLLQQAGLRLYCDERRVWRLDDVDAVDETIVSLSTRRNVTAATARTDREAGGYDSVVIIYQWTTSTGPRTAYDVAGPRRPRKTLTITHPDTPYPGPGGAQRVLDRVARRRRTIPITAAANYALRPTQELRLTSDDLGQQGGRVAAVTFEYPDRTMRVNAYDLEEIPPQSVRAIPVNYTTAQLPGNTAALRPGDL